MAALLAGCNMGIVGHFEFNGLHCADFNGNVRDFTVSRWYESDSGVEVLTEEAGSVFFSEGTYVMYENECPLCVGK